MSSAGGVGLRAFSTLAIAQIPPTWDLFLIKSTRTVSDTSRLWWGHCCSVSKVCPFSTVGLEADAERHVHSGEDEIMSNYAVRKSIWILPVAFLGLGWTGQARGADLGGIDEPRLGHPVVAQSPWSFKFTAYGWLPWISGDTVVKGRTLDVQVNPAEMLEHLDWSTLPAWMSYMEARRGPVFVFNDVVYAAVTGSRDFYKSVQNPHSGATLGGNVSVDYEQAIVEFGAGYEVWSGRNPVLAGTTAFDVLAGARYWHQDVTASADLATTVNIADLTISGNRVFAKSGSIDWVDPFIGGRIRHQLAPGQEIMVRGDIGGFGAGSEFSWQVLATYNMQLCIVDGYVLDSYLGYRALSVDYSQGSGTSRYEYNALQQGPVIGASLRY